MDVVFLVGFAVFYRGKILYISAGSLRDILQGGTRQAYGPWVQAETSLQIEDLRSNKNV